MIGCAVLDMAQVWDLETQHCVQTCVDHRSEVWAMDATPDGSTIVTGAADNNIRLWTVHASGAPAAAASTAIVPAAKKGACIARIVNGAVTIV